MVAGGLSLGGFSPFSAGLFYGHISPLRITKPKFDIPGLCSSSNLFPHKEEDSTREAMAIISPPANIDHYESKDTAIDDDDDKGAWENINCDSPGRKDGIPLFQRVDFKANLLPGRSLLSSFLERKPQNFQTATITDEQKATSHGKDPRGHSASPDSAVFGRSAAQPFANPNRTRTPIMISPHEVRKNIISTELPETIRLGIVRERSEAFSTANAVNRRKYRQYSDVSWSIKECTGDYNTMVRVAGASSQSTYGPPWNTNHLTQVSLVVIFKVVVKNRAVSMRLPDYYLNATQIFQAVDLRLYRRKKLLARLQENSHINKETDGVWVPFRDGVFLCKEVKLFEEVRNLFKHSDQPLPPD
ncbi:hypothetical protein M0657_009897 [Pyricularia oryzae]|uniref:HTH APSES-type domain-containing protein n=1 Tax=Pyricularia grisea TaxID=148305 RepID=A0A6P8BGI7_PYRGI|nr:uncharacterized protein PgNI_01065 [Pyricularia grisea]KAI7913669.1 hypothetical protein M0657_009897 [Pyricularia oryzae]TLD15825.1 hypothetical protein PgNI_01065 [Pyricularia grisea]